MSTNALERYKFEEYLETAIAGALDTLLAIPVYTTNDAAPEFIDDASATVTVSMGGVREDRLVTVLTDTGKHYVDYSHYDATLVVRIVIQPLNTSISWADEVSYARQVINNALIPTLNASLPYHQIEYILPTGSERTSDEKNRIVIPMNFSVLIGIKDSAWLPDPEPLPEPD